MNDTMKKKIYNPDGSLEGYDLIDRKTGKSVGWLEPYSEWGAENMIKNMENTPGFKEALNNFKETETNARLKKLEGHFESNVASDFMDIKKAAKYLGMSIPTIRRRIKEGKLPDRKVAGKFQFSKEELDTYRDSLKCVRPPAGSPINSSGGKQKIDHEKIARNIGLGGRRNK